MGNSAGAEPLSARGAHALRLTSLNLAPPSPAGLIFGRSVAMLGGYRVARSNDPARGANISRGTAGRAPLLLAVWCFHRKHDLRWPGALVKSEPERFRDLCLGKRCRGAGLFKSDGDRLLLRCWQQSFCVPNSGEPLAEQGKRILDGLKSCWGHDRLAIGRPSPANHIKLPPELPWTA